MAKDQKEYKEEASYYSTIPNPVMFHPDLSPHAKLLYAFITSLAKEEGYCRASNKYLANKFNVQRSSITNWIKSLADTGFITIELEFAQGDDGKPYIKKRLIYLTHALSTMPAKKQPSKDISKDKGVVKNLDGGGQINYQGVVKNLDGGGQKSRRKRIQAENTKAAAAKKIPPESQKAAAAPVLTSSSLSDPPPQVSPGDLEKLKQHFDHLNKNLELDDDFFPKVLLHLQKHDLGLNFVSWIYNYFSKTNPRSISNYLYRTFFQERYVRIYKNELAPDPVPQVVVISCPVCSTQHNESDPSCPNCNFSKDKLLDPDAVFYHSQLFSMPQDVKKSFEDEFELIFLIEDLKSRNLKLKQLNLKYGLLMDG